MSNRGYKQNEHQECRIQELLAVGLHFYRPTAKRQKIRGTKQGTGLTYAAADDLRPE